MYDITSDAVDFQQKPLCSIRIELGLGASTTPRRRDPRRVNPTILSHLVRAPLAYCPSPSGPEIHLAKPEGDRNGKNKMFHVMEAG